MVLLERMRPSKLSGYQESIVHPFETHMAMFQIV